GHFRGVRLRADGRSWRLGSGPGHVQLSGTPRQQARAEGAVSCLLPRGDGAGREVRDGDGTDSASRSPEGFNSPAVITLGRMHLTRSGPLDQLAPAPGHSLRRALSTCNPELNTETPKPELIRRDLLGGYPAGHRVGWHFQ